MAASDALECSRQNMAGGYVLAAAFNFCIFFFFIFLHLLSAAFTSIRVFVVLTLDYEAAWNILSQREDNFPLELAFDILAL